VSVLKKLNNLLKELIEHPKTGTGKPEQLKGDMSGVWARRINKKDRLIYSINDETVIVIILSAKGYYEK
jgi:toxin YoeB